jgi:hypothetical protein
MLNNRKRFVFTVALAAAFVLLAGGANALANTVWTVSKSSSNGTCSPGATTCNTIQAAVIAASPGDVINVGPGKYNETVGIGKPSLSLLGAQAGRDARVDRYDPTKESIVDASGPGGGGGAAFFVNGFGVVIDGFTVQGGKNGSTPNASGIYVTPGANVSRILNNIIQNNAMGLYFGAFYSSPNWYNSYFVLVKHNLFKTNNAGASGSSTSPIAGQAGFGIVGNRPADGTDITENEFIGNKAAAIVVANGANVEITGNTSNEDGSFAVFGGCYSVIFSHNQGKNFGAQGILPVLDSYKADAAVDAIINNQALQINDNDLEEGRVANYNGIDFAAKGANYVCFMCQVSNNKVKRFSGNGIVAEEASCASTLQWSGVSGNIVEDNGKDGILIGATPCPSAPGPNNKYNQYISLVDNIAQGNGGNDCEDDTVGGGYTPVLTLGRANTWSNNIGSLSHPNGLCSPGEE